MEDKKGEGERDKRGRNGIDNKDGERQELKANKDRRG